jgi:hypothetical protein
MRCCFTFSIWIEERVHHCGFLNPKSEVNSGAQPIMASCIRAGTASYLTMPESGLDAEA